MLFHERTGFHIHIASAVDCIPEMQCTIMIVPETGIVAASSVQIQQNAAFSLLHCFNALFTRDLHQPHRKTLGLQPPLVAGAGASHGGGSSR